MRNEYEKVRGNTELVYNYIIKEIFDKNDEINGYKNIKANPSKQGERYIASEIYTFFLTHYFKIIDLCNYKKDICIEWLDTSKVINIIDVGANIGTVTFAYLDLLAEDTRFENIEVNITFIELDEWRCEVLGKAIQKYIEVSGMNINYTIINEGYENSIDMIKNGLEDANTVILISNVLNWIPDNVWSDFRNTIEENLKCIDEKYGARVINIEVTSNTNSHLKIEKLYKEIEDVEIRRIYSNKKMPKFENLSECYFRRRYNTKKYTPKTNYFYGFLVKYPNFDLSFNSGIIEIAYNKALHTCKNYNLLDNLEMKYVNLNLENIKEYILDLLRRGEKVSGYNYQFNIKKSQDKTRPIYIDDFINDIIDTVILLVEGTYVDAKQDDKISYGNRINKDLSSPYMYNSYYEQYFNKLKVQERRYIRRYTYFCKIDLSKYYNSISKEILLNMVNSDSNFSKEWCNKYINTFVNKNFQDCESGYGIPQGPDLSCLLANMYLADFDSWFSREYKKSKIIRYVDDIQIFAKSKSECLEIKSECESYLSERLRLNVNPEKSIEGYTNDLSEVDKDEFYEEVSAVSLSILRSFYKIDKKNYKNFLANPKNFIRIYQRCLIQLGIYVSEEWLSLKVYDEIKFLNKMKGKIKKKSELKKWLIEKQIYAQKIKLGKIPQKNSKYLINNWAEEFRVNNRTFMRQLNRLNKKLNTKFIEIFDEIEQDNSIASEKKSILKFITRKLAVFKSVELSDYLDVMEDICPYYDKRILAGYSECSDYIIEEFLGEKDYTSYNYAMSIWLLGEYKNKEAKKLLEGIFIETIQEPENKNNCFINTMVTEALLKIGSCEFIGNIDISEISGYYILRNILLLANKDDIIDEFLEEILGRDFVEERLIVFIDWLKENKYVNITKEYEVISEEYREKYRDYPIDANYYMI